MTDLSYVILYVDSPMASGDFYRSLLRREPVQASPIFALFTLDSGLRLGLWARHAVEPAATSAGACAEIAMAVDHPSKVDAIHADWKARGLPIQQAPTDMDFGRTFVALDPDGHRLRVFAVARG